MPENFRELKNKVDSFKDKLEVSTVSDIVDISTDKLERISFLSFFKVDNFNGVTLLIEALHLFL